MIARLLIFLLFIYFIFYSFYCVTSNAWAMVVGIVSCCDPFKCLVSRTLTLSIFCSNASIFVDFGYDLIFCAQFIKMSAKINYY